VLISTPQPGFTFSAPTDRFDRPSFLTLLLFNTACRLYSVYSTTTAWTAFFSSATIMQTKPVILVAFAALGQARFGQEGAVQNIIQGLSAFGPPGAAGTLAGQTPGVLLAGANACAKVSEPNTGLDIECAG
jgi:hypothetical protein